MITRAAQERWFWFCSRLFLTFYWLLFSFRRKGRRHVPATGPLLVIANHQSYLDPILVGLAVGRRLTYMARKSLWRSKALGFMMDRLGAFPVDHEGPATEGVRACLKLLEQGEAVVVFPEGARTPDGEVKPLKPGVALILRKAKPPILPVGVAGAYEALPIWRKLPHFAPLGVPSGAGVAGAVGPVIPPESYAAKSTPLLLHELQLELTRLRQEAEQIRKKE